MFRAFMFGLAVGLLLSPRSGKQSRQAVIEFFGDIKEKGLHIFDEHGLHLLGGGHAQSNGKKDQSQGKDSAKQEKSQKEEKSTSKPGNGGIAGAQEKADDEEVNDQPAAPPIGTEMETRAAQAFDGEKQSQSAESAQTHSKVHQFRKGKDEEPAAKATGDAKVKAADEEETDSGQEKAADEIKESEAKPSEVKASQSNDSEEHGIDPEIAEELVHKLNTRVSPPADETEVA